MQTNLIENIVMIANERSLRKAADRLFVSSSALSQQLTKLEDELNAKLFDRSGWNLTAAGSIYLENARKVLDIKRETYNRIHNLARKDAKMINIGMSRGLCSEMVAKIFHAVTGQFPDYKLYTALKPSLEIYDDIMAQNLDIAFTTLDPRKIYDIKCVDLLEQDLYLLFDQNNPCAKYVYENQTDGVRCIDVKKCAGQQFVLSLPTSLNYWIDQNIFEIEKMSAEIFPAGSGELMRELVSTGAGIAIAPQYVIDGFPENVKTARLSIHHHLYIVAIYHKNHTLSHVEEVLIKEAKKYLAEHAKGHGLPKAPR